MEREEAYRLLIVKGAYKERTSISYARLEQFDASLSLEVSKLLKLIKSSHFVHLTPIDDYFTDFELHKESLHPKTLQSVDS